MTAAAAGHVIGYGGVLSCARGPDALSAWPERHPGLNSFDLWQQDAAFSPFRARTGYGAGHKPWSAKLRGAGHDALTERPGVAGIPAECHPDEWDDPVTGRLAPIHDTEGGAIDLWEPRA